MNKYILSLLLVPVTLCGAAAPKKEISKDDQALSALMNSLFLQVPIIRRNVTPEPITVRYRRLAPIIEITEAHEPIVIRATDSVHPRYLVKAGLRTIEKKKEERGIIKLNTLMKK